MRPGSTAFVVLSCLLGLCSQVSYAIQCYQCESSPRDGKFCRRTSEARLTDCGSGATFCSALVWMADGQVNVNRGCEGRISSWGFGRSECDVMRDRELMDTGVAFYQCRGDACNNIEPAEETSSKVVLMTQSTGNNRISQMSHTDNDRRSNMNMNMKSNSMQNSQDNQEEEEASSFASDSGINAQARGSAKAGSSSASSFPSNSVRNSDDMSMKSSRNHPNSKAMMENDDDQDSSYGAKPKPRPPRPPPPPPPPPPSYGREVVPDFVPEKPKVRPPPPPPPPPKVREEEAERRPPPPPPPPKPKPSSYGQQEEVMEAEEREERIVLTTPKRRVVTAERRTTTTTEEPEEEEAEVIQTEAPAYAPRTITTKKPTPPAYGEDVLPAVEREVTLRPRPRGRTVFDRK